MKMKESKPYPIVEEEDSSCMTAQEPVADVAYSYEGTVIPDDVDYARIVNGVLQVTPDIEEEIAEVDGGDTVSMAEFKNMFARWLWRLNSAVVAPTSCKKFSATKDLYEDVV